ncbi:hypothetical protein WJU23_17095 [Prosthecobacter sp. SYSU 5D2]|uniref:hypothetical protein n=1 Tax=Prosthecobacter sp. SYSU 5D2 TaxID=3134134 RepID=UPI0031FE89EE
MELRQHLENFSDHELVLFQAEAANIFSKLFSPRSYHLYCAVFSDEANGSGLTDFCSNLILSGRPLVNAVLLNADSFADVIDTEQYNQDSGLDVSSVAWHILARRYDHNVAEVMFNRGGVKSLDGIWERLEKQVGSINFEPDWRLVEATMPRIYARLHRE